MGLVVVRRNPMDSAEREEFSHTGPLIDFLLRRFPEGFPAPTVVLHNLRRVGVQDFDIDVGEDDEVLLLMGPGDPAGFLLTYVVPALIGTAVSMALSYVVSWLRGSPDADTQDGIPTSPTYSLSVPTNQARLGQPMPVIYGTVLAVPDIISQPYSYFSDNDQYVGMILGLGRKRHVINYLQVADTPVDDLAAGVVTWWDYPQETHQNTFGVIQNGTGVYEDVDTSPEVSNQELENTDVTGPFVANGSGTTTQRLGVDFVFPAGIHGANSGGDLITDLVGIYVQIWEIDQNGIETGYTDTFLYEFAGDNQQPIRATRWINVPPARYKVAVSRQNAPVATVGYESRVVWQSLKAVLRAPSAATQALYVLDTSVETDLSAWTVTGPATWGLVATATCDGTLNPHTTNPTFIATDATGPDTAYKSLHRSFDVTPYASSIDTADVRCVALCWITWQTAEPDAPAFRIRFEDENNLSLGSFTDAGDFACTWGIEAAEVDEIIPVGTRHIVITLESLYGGAGGDNNAYFDDVSIALIGLLDGVVPPVYEDMHLIPIRIKATNGLASDATRRIAVNATRVDAVDGEIVNPGYVPLDIYTDPDYGGGRPQAEVDLPAFQDLQAATAGTAGFNAVFATETTVWVAMQQAMRTGDAAPTPYGGQVTVVQDVEKLMVDYAFTTANMVDGTVQVGRDFDFTDDFDCYELEYLDPLDFLPRYTRYPILGVNPQSVTFFGCTNQAQAEHEVEFLWNKKYWRRKSVTFDTEAVGNLPLVGDLVSVVHPIVFDGSTVENYIVGAVRPTDQFRVTIEAIRDADIYEPLPIVP